MNVGKSINSLKLTIFIQYYLLIYATAIIFQRYINQILCLFTIFTSKPQLKRLFVTLPIFYDFLPSLQQQFQILLPIQGKMLIFINQYIYIIIKTMNLSKTFILLLAISILSSLVCTQSTCGMMCNCISSSCSSCYDTFQSNSTMSTTLTQSCPCPQGFYSQGLMCKFCPSNCKKCNSATTCIDCFSGYTNINGNCLNIKYNQNVSWVAYELYKDFFINSNGSPSLSGFRFLPSGSNIQVANINCSAVSPSPIVSLKITGNSNLSLVRVYSGLPYHQWAHLSLRYIPLDTWNGQQINIQFYMDSKIANKTYNNSERTQNICGQNSPDALDQIHSYIPHQKQTLAINITIPPNVVLALYEIKLDVGTCPRNCKRCSNPNTCIECKSYYANNNGTCVCNQTLSHPVSFGCVQNCKPGYFFVPGIQKCTLCSYFMKGCTKCDNQSVCLECNNSFLYQGACTNQCPSKYFPLKTSGNIAGLCVNCSANCTTCFNEQICLVCTGTLKSYQGSCVDFCPSGANLSGTHCYTSNNCSLQGCISCSSNICSQCEIGYWLNQTVCLKSCPPKTYYTATRACMACSSNCYACYDANTCQLCNAGYTPRGGLCQIQTRECPLGNYYDPKAQDCIACLDGCNTCYKGLCYTCRDGYQLDNGRCLTICSPEKYSIQDNITTNNFCYWRNLLCSSANGIAIDQCAQCRSMDYILSLGPDNKCRIFCLANKTFSDQSAILTDNQRYCNVSCPSNCQVCIQASICVKCYGSYLLSELNPGTCVSACQNGYVSDSVQCTKCPYQCTSCDISGNCLSWSQSVSNISCPLNCQMCLGSTCVKCSSNYYLNSSGLCNMDCPLKTFKDLVSLQCRKCLPQCSSCVSFSKCSNCIAGYFLNQQLCVRECPNGRYPNSQTQSCQICAPNCRTCFGPREHQCTSCFLGQVRDHSQCMPSCPIHKYTDSYGMCDWCHETCKYCFGPANFQCLQCDNDQLFLYRGQCYRYSCPANTYLAIIETKQCKDCPWGCYTCTSSTVCSQCYAGYYLNNGSCFQTCPTGTYFSAATNYVCVPCTFSNCVSCSQTTCYRCAGNYSLFNGTCIQGCPSGTFKLDYYYGLDCRACPPQCTTCTSQYQCTTCATGLILLNGLCTKSCEAGKYYDSTTNTCRTCTSGCASCTEWGCNYCQTGYYMYNNTCVQSCPASTYLVIQYMQCRSCFDACTACITFFQCTQCRAGYNLTNGICSNGTVCSTNCSQCFNQNNCLVCKPGYFRFSNSTGIYCVTDCPLGTFLNVIGQCQRCNAVCDICTSQDNCQQCKSTLITFMGQCISDCPPGFFLAIVNGSKQCQICNSTCQTCINSATNCTTCSSPTASTSNGTCTQKKQCLQSAFYSEAVGYCLPCVQYCLICHNPTKCDQCLQGYLLTPEGLCISKCPLGTYLNTQNNVECKTCIFPCRICTSATQCTECYPGYPLNTTSSQCQTNCDRQLGYFENTETNKCEQCDTKCLQCAETARNCKKCAAGYFLISGSCVRQCPQGTYGAPNVRACIPCPNFCQLCKSQTECQQCQPFTFLFNGSCFSNCPEGYYQQSGLCKSCIPPCRQCTGGSIYECTKCNQGYYFFNNRCISKCPDGYFANLQSMSCNQCPTACKTCTDFSNCQTCAAGYTLNTISQQCQVVPNCLSNLTNCKYCIQNTTTNAVQCSYCYEGFFLVNGTCVSQCPATFYADINTGRCESCPINCVECSNPSTCNKCPSNQYIFQGSCYAQCPSGTLPKQQQINNETILICDVDPCVNYYNSTNCGGCVPPFFVYQGNCRNNCPSGTYLSTLSCQTCSTGCKQCVSLTQCTKCITGYQFYEFDCIQNCPTSTYSYTTLNITTNTTTSMCLPCSTSCLRCVSSSNCSQCSTGYYLTSNNSCVTQCPDNFYPNPLTKKCQKCSSFCNKCASLDGCRECQPNTYLISGYCVLDCPDGYYPSSSQCVKCQQNCRSCDNSSNCIVCTSGYLLNRITNQCVIQCPDGTYQTLSDQCRPCATNCTTCLTQTQCLVCSSNLILFNGQCISQCPSGYFKDINRKCQECDSFCRQCSISQQNCTSCQQGYTLLNGFCINTCASHTFRNSTSQCQSCNSTGNNPRCSQCYGAALDQCIECYSPYYLINSRCVQNCPSGFFAVSTPTRQCDPCDARCLNCSVTPQTCTSCPWGYYLFNSSCISVCPNKYYPNPDPTNYTCLPCVTPCLQCLTSNICTVCSIGFYLTPSGTCVTNCSAMSNQTVGYFLNSNSSRCEPCQQNCLNCSSTNNCTNCKLPNHIYAATCVPDCPLSTYLDFNNICQPCTQNNCVACQDSTKCTQCKVGTYLFNGICVSTCPQNYVILDGKCIVDNNNQTICNYYWMNSTNGTAICVQYCPIGYYPSTTNTCLPCSTACLICSSSNKCQSCQDPYKLFNNTCVSICPAGYLQISSTCVKCSDNCLNCVDILTKCTSCQTNYYLFENQCVQVCPDGYYANSTTKKCQPCGLKCKTCTNDSSCTVCENNRYFPPGCSDNTCSSTQYRVEATNNCANCDTTCLTCYGGSSSNCLSCRSPLVLIDGQCRSVCPDGFVIYTANNTCISCGSGCKNCTISASGVTCIECFTPMILNQGVCISDCSILSNSTVSYTSDGQKCYPCSQNCLRCILSNHETNETRCESCKYGFILYLGRCISQCPTGNYSLQNNCYSCPTNCSICTSTPNSCTNCVNNTFLYNGICISQCPQKTYANTTTQTCIPCTDINCVRCTSAPNQCNQCVSPYTIGTNYGCNKCVDGYLYNALTTSCSNCDSSCLTCTGSLNNCSTCVSPLLLVDGRCLQSCPDGYYKFTNTTTSVSECRKCPINCTACSPSTTNSSTIQCFKCIPGYFHNIATHQCLPQCPTNSFITNSVDCNACPTNCTTCSSSTNCQSCSTGFYLYNGMCTNTCPAGYAPFNGKCQQCSIGCITCVSPTNCNQCRSDYTLNSNKSCDEIIQCTRGKYMDSNGTCQNCSTNCVECVAASNCNQCNPTTYLTNGQCSNQCGSNQYNITVTVNNTRSNICINCTSPCDMCISNVSCTHCLTGYYLNVNKSCVAECGEGYYQFQNVSTIPVTRQCRICADVNCKICNVNGCEQCKNNYYLFGYISSNRTNGACLSNCPSGFYKDNSGTPLSCKQCTTSNCDTCNSTQCIKCIAPYALLIQGTTITCVLECPSNMINITINGIVSCQNCQAHCLTCKSAEWCTKCDLGYYLFLAANISTSSLQDYNTTCVQHCPRGYFDVTDTLPTYNNTCKNCSRHCAICINQTNCTECDSQDFFLINSSCIHNRCKNCTNCVNDICQKCDTGFYLYAPQGRCYQKCPERFYGDNSTGKCQACMDYCLQCPNITMCDVCQSGYNFTGQACLDQAFILYGSLSNMSGFTSNITQITTAVYLGTSVGPLVFGQMTNTYFNIEFCQFILFHASSSGDNQEMQTFLDSLQSISLTVPSKNNGTGKRRMLASSLSDPMAFLATSAPIFGLMGGFLLAYILVLLFERYIKEESCFSCPNFKFYLTEICVFMKQRFKWIYFDFIAWISFLPFLYFSLMQLKAFSFNTGLEGFSSILAIVIVVVYPLYPFWIIYLLKQNYNNLIQQNNRLVQMSLSPYVYKVKRPTKQIMAGQPIKDYFNAQNFRLIYEPLKYIRKLAFVLVVALCPVPMNSLIALIIINVIFIAYMAVFRPRQMPYMIFDFIIEGILLFFEIFMVVYLANDSAKVTAMSIATHAIGFITANLSLVIAIILNLIAYYKIFMCIYELYKHLKEKMDEKQKGKLKDEQIQHQEQNNDLPEKDNLRKSLNGTNMRRRADDQLTDQDNSQINKQLMKDKQLFGDDKDLRDSLRKSKDLPDFKSSIIHKKKKVKQQDIDQYTMDNFFEQPKNKDLKLKRTNSFEEQQKLSDKKLKKKTESDDDFSINDQIIRIKQSKNKKNDPDFSMDDQIIRIKESKNKKNDPDFSMDDQIIRIRQNQHNDDPRFNMEDQIIRIREGKNRDQKNDPRFNMDDQIIRIRGSQRDDDSQFNMGDQIIRIRENNDEDDDQFRMGDQIIRIRDSRTEDDGQFNMGENIIRIRDSKDPSKDDKNEGRFKMNEQQVRIRDNKKQKDDDYYGDLVNDGIVRIRDSKGQQDQSYGNLVNDGIVRIRDKNSKPSEDYDYKQLVKDQYIHIGEGEMKQSNGNRFRRESLKDPNQVIVTEGVPVKISPQKFRRNDGKQKEIQSGKFKQRRNRVNPMYQEDEQQIGYQQRQLKKKKQEEQKLKNNQSINLLEASFVEQDNKKKPVAANKNKQSNLDEVNTYDRQNKKNVKEADKKKPGQKGIQEGNLKDRNKNQKNLNVQADFDMFAEEQNIEDVNTKQRAKKGLKNQLKKQTVIQGGKLVQKQTDKFRRNRGTTEQPKNKIQQDQQDPKKKKKRNQRTGQGQLGQQYQARKQKNKQEKKKKGNLGINQQDEQQNYQEVRRKNKDNLFSPDKGKASAMINSMNVDEFQDSDFDNRPESKVERPGSKGKGMLGIDDRSAHQSDQDSVSVRQRRNSAIQKLRKKQGTLNMSQKSDYSQDDSVSSRPEKKQKKQRRKKQKSGILQMKNKQGDLEGIQKIQL